MRSRLMLIRVKYSVWRDVVGGSITVLPFSYVAAVC
jgi:hypothetical protein